MGAPGGQKPKFWQKMTPNIDITVNNFCFHVQARSGGGGGHLPPPLFGPPVFWKYYPKIGKHLLKIFLLWAIFVTISPSGYIEFMDS